MKGRVMTKLLFENLHTFLPLPEMLAGELEIPVIKATSCVPPQVSGCIGFNYAMSCKTPGSMGVHFFLDDAQFIRLWNSPDRYIPMLSKFGYLCSPDFSTYSDMPKALQIYNHYRKHWLGAYWQALGLTVIPTISWSTPDSFEWCFDGEPEGGVVAIGTAGTQGSKASRTAFLAGYNAMLERLHPCEVLLFGKYPEGISGNVRFMGNPAAQRFGREA